MRQRVIVVGAGVAGLTAAHELIDRNFEVHVVERRPISGGKAASKIAASNRPVEHGFRFFPGWYRHLPDTLRRIPFKGRRRLYEGETVYDNLVNVDSNLLVWYDRDPIEAPMHLPRSLEQLKATQSFVWQLFKLDLAPAELSFFFSRLALFLAMPEDERRQKFQNMTWWSYLEADDKSRAFKDLISATTRNMVSAKATEASAYTICRLALRTLFDAFSNVDRVLNGPTNEKWIDPWVDFLQGRGVKFHFGWELSNIGFELPNPNPSVAKADPRVSSIELDSVLKTNLGRLRALLYPMAADLRSLAALQRATNGAESVRHSLRDRFYESATPLEQLLREVRAELAQWGSDLAPATSSYAAQTLEAVESVRTLAEGVLALHDALWLDQKSDASKPTTWQLASYVAGRALSEQGLPANTAATTDSTPVWAAAFFQTLAQASQTLRLWTAPLADANVTSYGDYDLQAKGSPKYQDVRDYVEAVFSELVMGRLDDAVRYLERTLSLPPPPTLADYYVLALPVEQMAYHVSRCMALTQHDPDLAKIVRLADYTDWMAGIQFYLVEGVDLGEGHVVGMDSEWALSAIEQVRHWDDLETFPAGVKSIVSVDIAAWDRRGRFVNKEAFNCQDHEIALEVWEELKAALGSDDGPRRLRDSQLFGGTLKKGVSYNIDDSIVDVFDRRKQGAYERARSARASVTSDKPDPYGDAVPYMWGPRLRFNIEPLLVNRVGSHELRPDAKTKVSNLFLASDYVQTETDLACMEGANEAARRAVNALLEVAGSHAPPCELWAFSVPGNLLDQLTNMAKLSSATQLAGEASKAAGKAADAAVDIATRTFGFMRNFWEKR